MLDCRILLLGTAALLVCLFGAADSMASVKCQCNNGTITHDMSSDYDDDDLDEACNDACSQSGGGQVWSADSDDDGDDVVVRPGGPRDNRPRTRR